MMYLLEIIPVWIREIPDNLKTQDMYNDRMRIIPNTFHHNPERLKTQDICNKAIDVDPW